MLNCPFWRSGIEPPGVEAHDWFWREDERRDLEGEQLVLHGHPQQLPNREHNRYCTKLSYRNTTCVLSQMGNSAQACSSSNYQNARAKTTGVRLRPNGPELSCRVTNFPHHNPNYGSALAVRGYNKLISLSSGEFVPKLERSA